MNGDRHAGTVAAPIVDVEALRTEVRTRYRQVATNPDGRYHFHTGRALAARLGYESTDTFPDRAIESFAGVANPFSLGASRRASGSSTSAPGRGSTRSSRPATSGPTGTSSVWT